jgi:deazaflavin-dependent oxidoreductase (nitroreductase family)
MSQPSLFIKLSNPFIAILLRSPLHGMLSASTMLITVRGKKSGRTYTTPVNYLRYGNTLFTISSRDRRWWRNLRNGASVIVLLQGKEVNGWGKVIEDERGVEEALCAYLQHAPGFARYLGIKMDEQGLPVIQDISNVARTRVMVQVSLD